MKKEIKMKIYKSRRKDRSQEREGRKVQEMVKGKEVEMGTR